MTKRKVHFSSAGNTIRGILFMPDVSGEKVPAVMVSHGAFEYKERYVELCENLAMNKIASLVVDMNGHGESEGDRYHIDMRRWISDIRAGIDFLTMQPGVNPDAVAAFGLSTGGTAVIEAALVDARIKALMLFAPTVRNIMKAGEIVLYSLLAPLGFIKKLVTGEPLKIYMPQAIGKKALAWDKEINTTIIQDKRFQESYVPIPGSWQSSMVDTIKRAERITIPTLIMQGENDEIDSPDSSKMLYKILRCEKNLILMPETGHLGHLDGKREKIFEYTAEWVYEHLEKG
jgi:alpha-beta hydrolase superfamily lysophospholipase